MQGGRGRAAQGRSVASELGNKAKASNRGGRDLQRRLKGALDAEPDLAPGIERSMVRAFWSRTPLAAHCDARAIAGIAID
jgi:hypothetical protein